MNDQQIKKVRGDAKLERLNAEQQERLLHWLDDENRTYIEVAQLVRTEFGLSVGKSAVADYWQRHVMPQRCRDQVDTAEEIAALPDGKFVEAMLKLAKRYAWDALARPNPDVRKAAAMMSLVHGADRLDLARERVALAKRRAAVAEGSAAPAQPSPLNDEEKARQPRDLFATGDTVSVTPPEQNSPLFPGSAAIGGNAPGNTSTEPKVADAGTLDTPARCGNPAAPEARKIAPPDEPKKAVEPQAPAPLATMPGAWYPRQRAHEYPRPLTEIPYEFKQAS